MSGIYIGAMGMLSYMTKLNTVANNIANVQTKGYKLDTASFRTFEETNLIERNFKDKRKVGSYENMVYVDDIKTNFKTGSFETSDNQLDMAITDNPNSNKKTFFVVSKDGQDYLTKNGQFTLDEQRRVSTYTGELLLGEDNNPITIPDGQKYTIDKSGEVRLYDSNEVIGKIKTVSVSNDNLAFLQKEHGSLFSVMTMSDLQNQYAPINTLLSQFDNNVTYQKVFGSKDALEQIAQTGQINIVEASDGEIQSYALESSNVDLGTELTDLMDAERGVQMSQRVWQTLNDILEKESSSIGKN